jgi:hypothetical protein
MGMWAGLIAIQGTVAVRSFTDVCVKRETFFEFAED